MRTAPVDESDDLILLDHQDPLPLQPAIDRAIGRRSLVYSKPTVGLNASPVVALNRAVAVARVRFGREPVSRRNYRGGRDATTPWCVCPRRTPFQRRALPGRVGGNPAQAIIFGRNHPHAIRPGSQVGPTLPRRPAPDESRPMTHSQPIRADSKCRWCDDYKNGPSHTLQLLNAPCL